MGVFDVDSDVTDHCGDGIFPGVGWKDFGMRIKVALVVGLLGLAHCSDRRTPIPGRRRGSWDARAGEQVRAADARDEQERGAGSDRAPTDQNSHITGKAMIPIISALGPRRSMAHYKGEACWTFDSRAVGSTAYTLVGVKVDRAERGYVQ